MMRRDVTRISSIESLNDCWCVCVSVCLSVCLFVSVLDGTCPKGWLAQQDVVCVGLSVSLSLTVKLSFL